MRMILVEGWRMRSLSVCSLRQIPYTYLKGQILLVDSIFLLGLQLKCYKTSSSSW